MASPGSDGEIPDTPPKDQFSPRHDHDGRSALSAAGHRDRNLTQEADGDDARDGGRRRKRHTANMLTKENFL